MSTAVHLVPWAPPEATVRRIDPAKRFTASRALRGWVRRAASSGIPLQHFYGAFDARDRLTAAAVLSPQVGRTGLLFVAPPGRRGGPDLTRVVQQCCRDGPRDRLVLVQSLLTSDELHERQALAAAGFQDLTSLAYMQTRLSRSLPEPAIPADVELCGYQPALHEQFVQATDCSYRQSLDCPRLRGLRQTCDVLAGHRAVGVFDAQLWTLVRIAGQPAGVVLLNRVPAAASVELVYLGLAPEHRGRGLATVLLRRAMAQCARRGEAYLTLAVDVDNAPAMALYRHAGFTRTATRHVMMYPLHETG
jgi:ribosomal protein S18 acetylase RimI-like enzyme